MSARADAGLERGLGQVARDDSPVADRYRACPHGM